MRKSPKGATEYTNNLCVHPSQGRTLVRALACGIIGGTFPRLPTYGGTMSIVFGLGLSKHYGAQDVFADVDFAIARGDKIGLLGPNGAGKTTLLGIILGLADPDEGEVHRARGLRIGYLPQEPEFPSEQTLYAEMLSVFGALQQEEQALLALAEEMAVAANPEKLMERYAVAQQRFELAGGYTYETRIKRVLSGLGFGPDTYQCPVARLSGGQVTRALLAKLLLEEPELLLLDEPSTHLDLEALEWLESYLGDWSHSLLVVAHDRFLLDKIVARVWELSQGRLQTYRGNYTAYVAQRRERVSRHLQEYQEQQELIAKTEDFCRRYRAGQRSKEARGRAKRLSRLERIERPHQDRRLGLRLSTQLRAGDNVLMSEGSLIGHRTRPEAAADQTSSNDANGPPPDGLVLFNTGRFLIRRGQRVALLGPNGAGKTTFLRTIVQDIEPLAGHIRLGASVRIGYLAQSQDWLVADKTVLEQVLDLCDLRIQEARTLLGRFLFSGDEVFKKIGGLSGGEHSRLALAILTIRRANFLLLDEPTTHLDLASQEIVQDVLANFTGTILLVSHDRYLVDAVATHVWVINQGRMRQFEGNYSSYLKQLAQESPERVEATQARARSRHRDRTAERAARKRAEHSQALEAKIAQMEQRMAAITGLIDQASSRRDLVRVHSLSSEYQQLEVALAERFREWERTASLERQE